MRPDIPRREESYTGVAAKKKIVLYCAIPFLFYFSPGTIAYAAGPSLRSQIRKKDEHMAPSVARDGRARVKKEKKNALKRDAFSGKIEAHMQATFAKRFWPYGYNVGKTAPNWRQRAGVSAL
jgi:DNA primase large subunit